MRETNNFPYIDKTYHDTMDLLQEARSFVSFQQSSANDNKTCYEEIFITSETSRLISHLTNVMAWVLWHKAADSGEISYTKAQQMGDEHLREEIYAKPPYEMDVNLPSILKSLIGRAGMLHARVNRLSQLVH